MAEKNRPDLVSHPHVSQEPLRTGNPAQTLADREDVVFGPATDMEGRMWGGYAVLIIAAVLLGIGAVVIWWLPRVMPW